MQSVLCQVCIVDEEQGIRNDGSKSLRSHRVVRNNLVNNYEKSAKFLSLNYTSFMM
jgi:hypothetical protein